MLKLGQIVKVFDGQDKDRKIYYLDRIIASETSFTRFFDTFENIIKDHVTTYTVDSGGIEISKNVIPADAQEIAIWKWLISDECSADFDAFRVTSDKKVSFIGKLDHCQEALLSELGVELNEDHVYELEYTYDQFIADNNIQIE